MASPVVPPPPAVVIPRQRRARIATAAAFAAQGLMFTVLLTHLPQFTDRYHVSDGTVTLIVLMVTVLAGVGSLLSEVLAGRASSRTALRTGLLVVAIAGTVIGLAPDLAVFVLGFAVYGLGVGAVDAAGNMQAVAVQHRYGRSIITSFHAVWSAAAITGALYVSGGEHLGSSLGVSILPVAAVVLLIMLLAGPSLLPREPDPAADPVDDQATARASDSASGVPEPVAVVGSGDDDESSAAPDPAASTAASTQEAETGSRVAKIAVTGGPLLILGLAMTCFWSVDSGVSNWSALYLRNLLKASNSTAALGYALYQATALVSRLTGDHAVRRFGAVRAVRAGALIGTTGTLLVAVAPGPVVAILGFGLAGLGLPVVAPLCFSAAGAAVRAAHLDSTPQQEANAVDSVVARLNVFNYLGSLLGAVVVGGVATVSNLRVGFVVPVLLAASVFFLARGFSPLSASTPDPAGAPVPTGTAEAARTAVPADAAVPEETGAPASEHSEVATALAEPGQHVEQQS